MLLLFHVCRRWAQEGCLDCCASETIEIDSDDKPRASGVSAVVPCSMRRLPSAGGKASRGAGRSSGLYYSDSDDDEDNSHLYAHYLDSDDDEEDEERTSLLADLMSSRRLLDDIRQQKENRPYDEEVD